MSQQTLASSSKTKSCFTLNLDNYKDFVRSVQADPKVGRFRFSTRTEWQGGTITQTVARDRVIYADEPEPLGGQDSAADPVELLLAALNSCVSIGLVTQAASRGVGFDDFEIEVTGDLDLRGYLGLDDSVRPGYTNIEHTVWIDSDAPQSLLEEILQSAERTSPMFDNIQNGVPIRSRLEVLS